LAFSHSRDFLFRFQFDFLGLRKLTGVVTKGGEYGWVKSFTVAVSKDNVIWTKLMNDAGMPLEFLANVDSDSVKKNLFRMPVNAQYLRIQPTKWHGAIELKLEPLGCFQPYRE
jgi:F5/8 type C domain